LDLIFIAEVSWFNLIERKEQLVKRFPYSWKILALSPFKWGERKHRPQLPPEKRIKTCTVPFFTRTNYRFLKFLFGLKIVRELVELGVSLWIKFWVTPRYKNPIIITENIYWAHLLKKFLPRKIFFDCCDNFLAFPNTPHWAKEYFEKTVFLSNEVFVSSLFLVEEIRKISPRKKVHLIGNGVDLTHFDKNEAYPRPHKLRKIKNKILGYVGSISSWFDFELVEKIALRFQEETILLIGPVHQTVKNNLERLKKHKNILPLGPIDYQLLPAYLAHFAIGIIPVKKNLLTKGMNMSKIYLYLAMEKPVVTISLPSFEKYKTQIKWVDSHAEFIRAIEELLNNRYNAGQLFKIAKENSWDTQAKKMEAIISSPH
jgi:hypothetical protein